MRLANGVAMDALQKNIEREMEARGWSRSELARRCNWAPARITEVLQGKFDPRLSTLARLAQAFGMDTPAQLLIPNEENFQKNQREGQKSS